jgi:ZIP family zinc transporter
MSTGQTLLLGAIAGVTIFLGLPMARMRGMKPELRVSLTAVATGILVFLLWDVLSNGVEPVSSALDGRRWGDFTGYAALLAGGFALGLMSLVHYDSWVKSRRSSRLVGPGAAAVDEFVDRAAALSPARQLAVLIGTGIGLHNVGEGLAFGKSTGAGDVALAVVLIIGFALHNATEGFGIAGPLAGESEPPSWRFLGLLGLIGGGPTFLGTAIGYAWVSTALQVAFFAVAAGSILYVVLELAHVCRRYSMPRLVGWMVILGLVLGFGTDFVLDAVGA